MAFSLMRTWRRVVAVLFVVGTALLFHRWWQVASTRADRRRPAPESAEANEPDRASTDEPRAPVRTSGTVRPGGLPPLDRAHADRMRAQIHAWLADGGSPSPKTRGPDASASPAAFPSMPLLGVDDAGRPQVDPAYVQKRVHEDLFPVAQKCYADALARRPGLSGKLVVYFRVIGDKSVGGVVDEVRVLGDTTLDDAELQTCVRESMMAVTFDAPPDDEGMTVVYPLLFSPDDEEGGRP